MMMMMMMIHQMFACSQSTGTLRHWAQPLVYF